MTMLTMVIIDILVAGNEGNRISNKMVIMWEKVMAMVNIIVVVMMMRARVKVIATAIVTAMMRERVMMMAKS